MEADPFNLRGLIAHAEKHSNPLNIIVEYHKPDQERINQLNRRIALMNIDNDKINDNNESKKNEEIPMREIEIQPDDPKEIESTIHYEELIGILIKNNERNTWECALCNTAGADKSKIIMQHIAQKHKTLPQAMKEIECPYCPKNTKENMTYMNT